MPLRGNGMGHEAEEVMRCLRAGLLESPLIPLAATLEVMSHPGRGPGPDRRELPLIPLRAPHNCRTVAGWERSLAPASGEMTTE